MPVTMTGTPVKNTDYLASSSQAVTIPSDAEAVIVCCGLKTIGVAGDFTELNWDNSGLDFTLLVTNTSTANEGDVMAYIMTNTSGSWPGTGAKTLYWTLNTTPVYGGTIYIFFVKGLDTTTPKRDSAFQKGSTSFTSAMAGVVAGDLSFGMVVNLAGYTAVANGGGQTLLASAANENSMIWAIGYEAGEAAIVLSTNDATYVGYIAFSLRVAAGTAAGQSMFLGDIKLGHSGLGTRGLS